MYWSGPGLKNGEVARVPLGPYLYPGTTGVALFLAAMERAAGGGGYGELCLRALAPLRRELTEILENPERSSAAAYLLGGMSGLGSLMYAFLKIGILLGEPSLICDARNVSLLMTPQRILEDRSLDVMLGSAGALMALLALDREASAPNSQGRTPLELAISCGAHLLSRKTHPAGGLCAWPLGSTQLPLGGFAHGTSGISCALLRLHGRTGESDLLAAAREGIAHERTLYRLQGAASRLSWRPGVRFLRSWCNGLPGIALSRLEILNAKAGLEDLEEIAGALEVTRSAELDDDDLVCCGNMGRVDILLHAERRLSDASLGAAARALALLVLERVRRRGGFGLMAFSPPLFDPRFFLGVAGIGYILLRLNDSVGLPCVLALD